MKSILKPHVLGMAAAVLSISLGSNALMAHGMDAAEQAKAQAGSPGMMMAGMPMANTSSGMGGSMMAMMSSGACPMMGGNAMSQTGQTAMQPMAMMSQMMQLMSGQIAAPMTGAGH